MYLLLKTRSVDRHKVQDYEFNALHRQSYSNYMLPTNMSMEF